MRVWKLRQRFLLAFPITFLATLDCAKPHSRLTVSFGNAEDGLRIQAREAGEMDATL
jgi:hypothetical protein